MRIQRSVKFWSVLLVLSLVSTSLYATSQSEVNATYIYLPKIPKVDAKPPIAEKAVEAQKVKPVITVTPQTDKKKNITQKEYLEYQKLKAKNQDN